LLAKEVDVPAQQGERLRIIAIDTEISDELVEGGISAVFTVEPTRKTGRRAPLRGTRATVPASGMGATQTDPQQSPELREATTVVKKSCGRERSDAQAAHGRPRRPPKLGLALLLRRAP
jgi:hypothetical protein